MREQRQGHLPAGCAGLKRGHSGTLRLEAEKGWGGHDPVSTPCIQCSVLVQITLGLSKAKTFLFLMTEFFFIFDVALTFQSFNFGSSCQGKCCLVMNEGMPFCAAK